MFRLLIVDDEKNERDCLRYLIENAGLALEMEQAENGAAALSLLEEKQVDILLTDVQMPVMGGLELIDQVSRRFPEVRIIIFSNYAEFEYARAAIHFGVENYILKPVVPSELEHALRSVMEQLEEERSTNQRMQTSMLQLAIQSAIYGTLNPDSFPPDTVDRLSRFRRLVLIDFSSGFLENHYAAFYEGLRSKMGLDFISLNFSPQALLVLRQEISNELGFGMRLFRHIQDVHGIQCNIAISPPITEETSLRDAFSAVEQQMEQRFWSQSDHVFLPQSEPVILEPVTEKTDDDTLLTLMKNALAARDGEKFTQSLNLFLDKYQEQVNQSQIYVKFIFSNLVASLYPFLPDSEKQNGKSMDDLISQLYLQRDLSKIVEMVQNLAHSVVSTFGDTGPSVRRELVIVQQYIHEHYGQELSVELLAATVFLSPDYLSRLFKKQMGKSLYQYIRQFRMEKASQLLRETTKKVIDIGIETGYPNYSYFCQSFREYFGKSPERYRQEEAHG